MKRINRIAIILFAVIFVLFQYPAFAQQNPRVFARDAKALKERKSRLDDPALKLAIASLERSTRHDLATEFQSIVTKTALPPSGDKHDYMSQAPYFWKNPDTKTGFPYVRRDGERNPEIKNFPDHDLLDNMIEAVERLSTAYYYTGNEKYAAKASAMLRMWFVDAETRMNPNLEFAQAIPGLNTGRGIGIIETRGLTRVIDSIGMLEGSRLWKQADQTALESWFAKYLDWLMTSKNGRDEAASKNNHGTYYDVQIAAFALFVGKNDVAKKVLESAKQSRIAKQIEPDGSHPLELARTKSWSYSTMNLEGMVTLAVLGDAVGVDLWNFQTPDGRGIRKAIDFLYPYAIGEKKWTHKQIEEFRPERLYSTMRRAAVKYSDARYKQMMSTVPDLKAEDKNRLLAF